MLTHWGRDKFAVISKTILSNALSWMNMYKFRLRFHWSLFPTVQLTLSELMMVSLLTHICVTRLNVIVLQRVASVDHFYTISRIPRGRDVLYTHSNDFSEGTLVGSECPTERQGQSREIHCPSASFRTFYMVYMGTIRISQSKITISTVSENLCWSAKKRRRFCVFYDDWTIHQVPPRNITSLLGLPK